MKGEEEIRLFQEPGKSFIVYNEKLPFSPYHYHPEYELSLIVNGSGIKMIGDYISRFEDGDLVFLGSHLAHTYKCDKEYYNEAGEFKGRAIVIQFLGNFLGSKFFEIPENKPLLIFLEKSNQGIQILGETKNIVKAKMLNIVNLNDSEKLFSLLEILKILANSEDIMLLASPSFSYASVNKESRQIHKAVEYILENFQRDIKISELLELANMSNTSFSILFKKSYRMSAKQYLLNVRTGYACRLMGNANNTISQIAYESGFENMSNFNRLFKKIKGETPSEYRKRKYQIII